MYNEKKNGQNSAEVENSANELKLAYSENIGLTANCPKVIKKYNTQKALVEDYIRFKVLWTEIVNRDPYHYSINEKVDENYRILALTTTVTSDGAAKVSYTYVKTVEIWTKY